MNRVWLRLVLVVLAAYVVTSIGLLQQPRYEATALLLVGQKGRTLEYRVPPETKLVMHAIDTRPVAEEAIRRLGLEMTPVAILENLTTEQIGGTQFMQVSYRATDPVKATKIANTVSGVFSEFATGRRSDLAVEVWEQAKVSEDPVSPDPWRNGLLTLGVTLALSVVLTHGAPRSLAAGAAQIVDGLAESVRSRVGQALTVARTRLAARRLASLASPREVEAIKEQELLEAMDRRGRLTPTQAALETSLGTEEAAQMLFDLAAQGHIELSVDDGRLVYSFWGKQAA